MARHFRFDIRLRGVTEPPWRDVLLRYASSFLDLHRAIQDACGWKDEHLFAFRGESSSAEAIAGSPDPDERNEREANHVRASGFFKNPGDRLVYEYDASDAWEHDVTLKEILDINASLNRCLLDGALAFPPEDCGGVAGYEDCRRVLAGGEDTEGLKDWLGTWRPDHFNLEATKRAFDR